MSNIMSFSYDSRPIQTIVNQIKNVSKRDGIDLQPPYQRGFIWGNEFMDKLLFSIIKNYPIGNISLRVRAEKNEKNAMQEVVDGQQRLTTIHDFVSGVHNIQGECARKTIAYIAEYLGQDSDAKLDKIKLKLKNKGKVVLKFSQLPDVIRENFFSFNVSITNITNASDSEISEYFKFLQNQERLRAGEIINSIPDSSLEKYLESIVDKEKLFKIMTFSNERRQFDRAFYSVLGLIDEKIGFGVLDREVLKYAADCEELTTGKERCERLIDQINHIVTSKEIPHNLLKSNVRLMKFFLLTASLGLVDYTTNTTDKLVAIGSINTKLSAFSSAKAKEVERVFNSYSSKVIEEHRLLALISKGGHSLKRVQNRMEILAYYINNFECLTVASDIEPI